MRSCVPFKIEGVIETFPAESAQVALDVRVALHVPVEEALETERLGAEVAGESSVVILGALFVLVLWWAGDCSRLCVRQRVLDPMASVHKFQSGVTRESELNR